MGIVADMAADDLRRLEAAGEIEVSGNLKIWRGGGPCSYLVKVWKCKAKRPAYYSFKTIGAREQYVCREIDADNKRGDDRKRRAADNAASLAKYLEVIQIGTLLHYSWGYDQTNCEFFQVVARSGRQVTIRAISGEVVPNTGGDMSCKMRPVRDAFIDGDLAETFTKRIGPGGIVMPYGDASPCGDTDQFYCSWYA